MPVVAVLLVAVAATSTAGSVLLRDERKLAPSDVQSNEKFGTVVAVSGNIAVLGSIANEARVFERGVDDGWTEVAELADATARFGEAVAVSGDTVVVGAGGAAFVFQRDAGGFGAWGLVKELTPSVIVPQFGPAVAISGDTAAVIGGQTAYVFERDAGGVDNWGEVKILDPTDGDPELEIVREVAIHADTIVVGVPTDDGGDNGAGYVFGRDVGGPDNWGQVAKLSASDADGDGDLGISASIHEDTVVLGAPTENGVAGAAYVYGRNEGGPDNWGEVEKLTGSDTAAFDWFGLSVAVSGDLVVVGAYSHDLIGLDNGAAYVYQRDAGGVDNWGEVAKLVASDADGQEEFGADVSIDTDTALIGASDDFDAAFRGGSAYVYDTPTVRMFVTAESHDGALGGLSGGDAICQAEADAAGEAGIWMSLLSVPGTDAFTRVPAGLPVQRIDRAPLADDAAALGGDLGHPLDIEPGGDTAPAGTHVWTGDTDVDGHCLGFTATAGDTGGYGISSATDGDWHAAGEEACSISNRLYCFRFACPAVPVPSCADFDKGSLIVSETKVGKENLRLKLARGPALAQSDLGSPLTPDGTAYTVCLYEDGEVLRGTLDVNRAGDTCGSKPCWKAIGGVPDGKGWKYKDTDRIEDGIKIATLKGGAEGRSTIQLKGGNNVSKGQDDQPLGIARHLSGSTSVVAQIHGHDLAQCFTVTLDTVQKSLGTFFQAKR